ncbi:hypothetical protein D4S03_08470 [bacterium]|nr:MAG: hypothetical protein D4S03_08470 [bacterium]
MHFGSRFGFVSPTIVFLCVFVFLFISISSIGNYAFASFPEWKAAFSGLSIPTPSTAILLNLIGFVYPLILSAYFLGVIIKIRPEIGRRERIFFGAGVVLFLASLLLPLTYVDGGGARVNVFMLTLATLVAGYYVMKKDYFLAAPVSYCLGFLGGLVSDITAVFGPAHFYGVLGGLSFFDIDLLFPACLFVAVLIVRKIQGARA